MQWSRRHNGRGGTMGAEAQWARRRMAYAGAAPLLMSRSGTIGHIARSERRMKRTELIKESRIERRKCAGEAYDSGATKDTRGVSEG